MNTAKEEAEIRYPINTWPGNIKGSGISHRHAGFLEGDQFGYNRAKMEAEEAIKSQSNTIKQVNKGLLEYEAKIKKLEEVNSDLNQALEFANHRIKDLESLLADKEEEGANFISEIESGGVEALEMEKRIKDLESLLSEKISENQRLKREIDDAYTAGMNAVNP